MNYTPTTITIHGRIYGQLAVNLEICGHCERFMVDMSQIVFTDGNNVMQQITNARWEVRSSAQKYGKSICVTCKNAGFSFFYCYLCRQERKSNFLYQSFGDPPDHLCFCCYETVSAKEWDEILDVLNERHRFDGGR
jgi:hypothetical protein